MKIFLFDITALKEYNYLYENGKVARSSESTIEIDENGIVTKKSFDCTVRYFYDKEENLTKKRISFADGTEQVTYYEQAENDSQTKSRRKNSYKPLQDR